MEWIERLNGAVNYIEEHLTDEIDIDQAARVACCSTYHFQRMFGYMAGASLAEYVRRRRMSLAAAELQGGEKVLDVALKYGYSSPTAFNRAFQGVHGVPPSAVKDGAALKAFLPIRFIITVKGAHEMNYRVEKKGAMRIVGVSAPLHKEMEKNFEVVPQMWQKAVTEGVLPRLAGMMDSPTKGILGVSACNNPDDWKYFIAVASTMPADGLEEYTIEPFTWAIFPGEGQCPGAIQELEQRIISEWLPTSGFEYDNGPDVEVYLSPDLNDAKFEVWIPVVKK